MKDYAKIIKKPQGYEYLPTPEEIFNRAVRGQDIKPDPRMDVDGIIAYFQTMIDQQQKDQYLSNDQVRAAILTLRQFQQMKDAMDQQKQQVMVQQQMQANAAMSQNQAPTGMNPLQGSSPGQLPPPAV